jgi:hypothetical protein
MTRRNYGPTNRFMDGAEHVCEELGFMPSKDELAQLRQAHIALKPVDGPKVAFMTVRTPEDIVRAAKLEADDYEVTVEPVSGIMGGFTRPCEAEYWLGDYQTPLEVLLSLLKDKSLTERRIVPATEASTGFMIKTLNLFAEQLLTPQAIAGLMLAAGFKGRFSLPWGRGATLDDIVLYHRPEPDELKTLLERPKLRIVNGQAALKRAPWFRGLSPCGRILLGDGSTCQITEVSCGEYRNTWTHMAGACAALARHSYRRAVLGADRRGGPGHLDGFTRLIGLDCHGLMERADSSIQNLKSFRRDIVIAVQDQADKLKQARSKAVLTATHKGTLRDYNMLVANAVQHNVRASHDEGWTPAALAMWMCANWDDYIAINRG